MVLNSLSCLLRCLSKGIENIYILAMLIYQLLKSEYPFCGKISLLYKILELHIFNNQLVGLCGACFVFNPVCDPIRLGCITFLNEIFCEPQFMEQMPGPARSLLACFGPTVWGIFFLLQNYGCLNHCTIAPQYFSPWHSEKHSNFVNVGILPNHINICVVWLFFFFPSIFTSHRLWELG